MSAHKESHTFSLVRRAADPHPEEVVGSVRFVDGQIEVLDDGLAEAIATWLGHGANEHKTTKIHSARITTIRNSEPQVVVDPKC